MAFTNIIPPYHRTFLDRLSISFAPTADAVDGEYGGTHVPAATAGTATTIRRADFDHPRNCHYCKTLQQSGENCSNCGAPDDGKREPITMAPMRIITA